MSSLDKAFEIAVVISAVDHLTSPLKKMATQLGVLSKQTEEVQKKMAAFKATAMVGGAITLVGAGLAKGLVDAAEAAGRLQTSMMGVKEALGLSNKELDKMTSLAQTVGIPTIFSAEQVGGIMQAMATSGLSKQAVMDPNILRQYVNFADVQAQIKNENAPDVVSGAINMAHQYQLYSPQQIAPFLNQLNGALLHTHSTASEFATTYKYIANQARTMGMGSTDALSTTAWLDRMGFGSGRGGTNFADFLQRSIYHSSGDKADAAMKAAGFVQNGHSVFEDKNGQFVGITQAIKIMQDFGKRFNNNANVMNPLLHDIFGTQGARVAMMMTSSGASEQYTNVQKQIKGTASIGQSQKDLNNTWQGKVKQLQTTLADIQQAFGKSVMPYFLPIVKALDNILAKVLEFEQAHPKIMAFASGFAAVAAAALLVIGPLMTLVGVLGFLKVGGYIGAGFQILGTAFRILLTPVTSLIRLIPILASGFITLQVAGGPILWIIEAIIAVVVLLWLAWKNNWGNIRQHIAESVAWIGAHFQKILLWMGPAGWIILGIIDLVKNWKKYWNELVSWFDNTVSRMEQIGHNIVQGIWNGIKAEWDFLKNGWNKLVDLLPSSISKHLEIHSPSRVMMRMGGYVAEGLALGMTNNAHLVNKAANHLSNAAVPSIMNSVGGSGGSTTVHIHPGAVQIQGAGKQAGDIVDEMFTRLGSQTRRNNMSRSLKPNRLVFN